MNPSPSPLAGKVCLVTGASSGLGRATAVAMTAAAADVSLVARSADDLVDTADAAGNGDSRVVTLPADLSDADACREVVARTIDEFGGRLDVVVNAAGTDVPKEVEALGVGEWDRVQAVNLRAPFLLAKYAFPHMRDAGGGTIINISSVAGRRGWAGASAYCSSKFALTGLTQALNGEGRPHGIRACVVYPGAMDTHWGDWNPDERHSGDTDQQSDPAQSLPPSRVGDLVVWIASAPAELVLNESVVTPLHEQGWP